MCFVCLFMILFFLPAPPLQTGQLACPPKSCQTCKLCAADGRVSTTTESAVKGAPIEGENVKVSALCTSKNRICSTVDAFFARFCEWLLPFRAHQQSRLRTATLQAIACLATQKATLDSSKACNAGLHCQCSGRNW